MQTQTALANRIASLVEEATDGTLTREIALEQGKKLSDAGISSLSYLRLIDAIENEFGVYVDLEDETASLTTVTGIAAYVSAQGVEL